MHIASIVFGRRQRLPRFLLASVGLHIAIVLPWSPTLELAGSRETILTVSFDTQPRPNNEADKTTARTAAAEQRKIPAIPPAPAGLVAVSTPGPQTETRTNPSPTQDADIRDTQFQSVLAQIQARLQADLRRHFEYPLLARRQGWQGTVLLAFTLQSDGALQRIHVARSSGYDVLDDSAIAALKRVGRLSEAKHWLNGHVFEMRVPVVYQLKDN